MDKEEIDKVQETYNLPRLDPEEIESLKRQVTSRKLNQ